MTADEMRVELMRRQLSARQKGIGKPPVISPEQRAANVAANAGRQGEIDAGAMPKPDAPGAASAALFGLNQGATFGFGDEIVARILSADPNLNYDQALSETRGQFDAAREANPVIGTGAEIAGAVAMPLGAIKSGGSLALRAAKSAGLTGGLSALYGFGNGEGGFENRARNAAGAGAVGGSIGAAIPFVGSGLSKLLQGHANNKALTAAAKGAPSTDELRTMGNAAYKAVDDAGVQIKPEAFDRARGSILDDLRLNTGFDELPGPGSLTPNSARVNEIMGQASTRMSADPTAALPFKALDQMRRQAGAAAGNVANKTDQKAGVSIIQGLDDMIANLGAKDVVAGDIAALQTALPKARETWSRMTKSQRVDDAIEAGSGNYLSGASSGIRNQFRNLLKDKKAIRGYSAPEIAAIRKVVNGSIPEQLLNLAGGGLGQMATAGAGFGMGGLPGLMLGSGIAAGSRKLAEKVTTGKAEKVRALIANGGLQSFPQISSKPVSLIEKLLRQGTATAGQTR